MTATEYIIDFNNNAERDGFVIALRRLRGRHRISIVKHRRRRTDRQNRYYWPVFVKSFGDFLREQGENVTDDQAHEMLKHKFLRQTWIDGRTGEALDYTRSTTALDVAEFNQYLDSVALWLADMFGIIVPSPDEYHEKEEVPCEVDSCE